MFIGAGIGMAVTASKEKTANGSTTKYKGLMAGAVLFGVMGLGVMIYAFMGGGASNSGNGEITPLLNMEAAEANLRAKPNVSSVEQALANTNAQVAETAAKIQTTAAKIAQNAANKAAAVAAEAKANAEAAAARNTAKLTAQQTRLRTLGQAVESALQAKASAAAAANASVGAA